MTFDRNAGFNPDTINRFRTQGEANANKEHTPFNRFGFFKNPEGVKNFVPKAGVYTFDVLQFPLSYSYHPFWNKKHVYDLGPNPHWFERTVFTHETGFNQVVCGRTFSNGYNRATKQFEKDLICNMLWDEQDTYDYRNFNKRYSIFVIRMYPNEDVGNADYEIMTFVSSCGIFSSKLYEEYELVMNTNDKDNMSFFQWNAAGKSVKARFVENKKVLGGREVKWVACDRVDFVDRKDQLTDKDIETVCNLNIDECIVKPTDDDYARFKGVVEGTIKPVVPARETTAPAIPERHQETKADEKPSTFDDLFNADKEESKKDDAFKTEEDDDLRW